MEPTHYTMVKGVLSLYQQPQVELSAALENGIILMSNAIGSNESIYINGNHFDEELIMTCRGELEEGLNPLVDDIQAAIRLAIKPLTTEPQGGIFYIHCNIPEDCFSYRQNLLSSIFLGVSLINGLLNDASTEEIITTMSEAGIFGDKSLIKQLFSYKNRMFTLKVGEDSYDIELERDQKMVFCQLDLAKQDIKHER